MSLSHGHWIGPAVSLTAGVICLVLAVLIRTTGEDHSPRAVVVLLLTGVTGLLGTPVGHWIHDGVNKGNHALSEVISPVVGPVTLSVLAFVPAYIVGIHWHRHRINDRTYVAAISLPFLVTLIPGWVGAILTLAVFGPADLLGWAVVTLFNLH
jgi:hypothetical protein